MSWNVYFIFLNLAPQFSVEKRSTMYVVDLLKIHNWKPAILFVVFEIPWPGDIFLRTDLLEGL